VTGQGGSRRSGTTKRGDGSGESNTGITVGVCVAQLGYSGPYSERRGRDMTWPATPRGRGGVGGIASKRGTAQSKATVRGAQQGCRGAFVAAVVSLVQVLRCSRASEAMYEYRGNMA
jgi:hypothetical protein